MANEGYLIGYEDAQGNFVQIGQFNNAADDVTQPLVLRHTNSGETLELDGSSFRPSTQIGEPTNRPDVFANTVDLNSLVGAGLDTKADLTQSGGVLVASQLPDLAITNIDVVADQSARLALNAEEGDVAIQTDVSETFILSTNDPTVNSNWKKVQLDVLGAIDGQMITPAQTGTSSNPTTIESDTVTATNIEAGQIGDSSNRSDLFADQVDANTTKTDTNLRVGGLDFINHIEKFQTGGTTANISVPTVESGDGVKTVVECYYDTGTGTADCLLRFNGDGSSTGNYQYQTDEGASEQTNQDEIKLLNVFSQFGFASFTIEISAVEYIGVTIDTREYSQRCDPVAVRGRRAANSPLDSIQIIPDGSARSFFGRVYQRELK